MDEAMHDDDDIVFVNIPDWEDESKTTNTVIERDKRTAEQIGLSLGEKIEGFDPSDMATLVFNLLPALEKFLNDSNLPYSHQALSDIVVGYFRASENYNTVIANFSLPNQEWTHLVQVTGPGHSAEYLRESDRRRIGIALFLGVPKIYVMTDHAKGGGFYTRSGIVINMDLELEDILIDGAYGSEYLKGQMRGKLGEGTVRGSLERSKKKGLEDLRNLIDYLSKTDLQKRLPE